MLWARKWLSGDGMKPGCPALLRQSHLIGPGYCKIVGLYHRNIPERHQRPPGASPRAFINAMGPRLQSPARRRHGPVRVAAAWDGNSSKITHHAGAVLGRLHTCLQRMTACALVMVDQRCSSAGDQLEQSYRFDCLSCFGPIHRLQCRPAWRSSQLRSSDYIM